MTSWRFVLSAHVAQNSNDSRGTRMKEHVILPENADRIRDWIQNRGGIFIWSSIDLSDPGKTWTSPSTDKDGNRVTKPHWQCGEEPIRHITSEDDVVVEVPKEVKRFRVGVRRASNNPWRFKVTDGGTRRIRSACARATERYGTEAWYCFDYDTQEAVIMVAEKRVPLPQWGKTDENKNTNADGAHG